MIRSSLFHVHRNAAKNVTVRWAHSEAPLSMVTDNEHPLSGPGNYSRSIGLVAIHLHRTNNDGMSRSLTKKLLSAGWQRRPRRSARTNRTHHR